MNSQAGVYWGRARQSRVSCANAGFESYSVWRAPALGLPALGIVPCAQFHLISKVNLNLCRPHLKDSGKAESTLFELQPGARSSATSPQHPSPPGKDTRVPTGGEFAQGAGTSGQVSVHREVWLPLPLLRHRLTSTLCCLVPGQIVFLMETGTAPWFVCCVLSVLYSSVNKHRQWSQLCARLCAW